MAQNIEVLEKQLLALPGRERARIAHELIVSLDGGVEDDAEGYWSEEIQRRLKQIDGGEIELSSGDEVFARARKALSE